MRHVSDNDRLARLAVRHAVAPVGRVGSPEAAARAMTVLHATEPATVYLSCWARVRSLSVTDIDQALYVDRSLVKQLAMRRTLFVFPRDLLPAVWPSASARVAAIERARMSKDLVNAGLTDDGHDWLDRARYEVVAALTDAPQGRSASELRQAVPRLDVTVPVPAGESWSMSRVLTYVGASADIMRGTNDGRFNAARPRWTLRQHWLDDVPESWSAVDGYRELVRRWLHTFGPGTEDDIVWWLGATKTIVRAALAELEAVAVSLDSGATGWLLPDDLDLVPDPEPWVALLPVLDPTVMGWKQRDFYLGPHGDQVFDSRGNAGTTAWADGRVVGCWTQDERGAVELRLLQPVTTRSRRALETEAERLTAWLDGVRINTGYRSPAMKHPPPDTGPWA